jgi:hypothetical protein
LNAGTNPSYVLTFSFKSLPVVILIFTVVFCDDAQAQFAARFSLTVAEEYNDNIFFTKDREHDFITNITPTFTLIYQPPSPSATPLTLNISPTGQIFARNPDQNNFGDGVNINGGYTYQYSPRLSFNVRETFRTIGRTQTGTLDERLFNQTARTPTAPAAPGMPLSSLSVGSFIPNGRTLENHFDLSGSYLYSPNIRIGGGFGNSFINYLDEGGTDITNYVEVRGSYNWREEHNLYAEYRVEFLKSRDNGNSVVHNFNIGDDFFSNTQIQLTPTLTLTLSTGLSLNTSSDGPRVANNTNVQLTKLWERATLRTGVFKGLTSSFGVAGISDTIDFVTAFDMRLTEKLSVNAGVDYSFYNTDDVNFKPFRAYGGVQYGITSWLCSGLRYTHRRLFGGSGGQDTVLQTDGNVHGNSLFLLLTASFDVWPTVRLARSAGPCSAGIQSIRATQSPGLPAR